MTDATGRADHGAHADRGEHAGYRDSAHRDADADVVDIVADGRPVRVRAGTSVAVALLEAGVGSFRKSVSGEPRAPVCGMGSCFECRVTIDGVAHRRACLVLVRAGMTITTADLRSRP